MEGHSAMNADEFRTLLDERQVRYEEKEIQDGRQFRCISGEIFTVYDTGKMVPGGQKTTLTSELVGLATASTDARPRRENPVVAVQESLRGQLPPLPDVFIVHGHDTAVRDQLELRLRRFGLNPVILQNLPPAGDTIIEKLEKYLGEHGNVGYACVLLTPDDEGHRAGAPEENRYRSRQNVVLELGMVLARLGRHRVTILHKQSVELPSDIAGLIYVGFNERIDEVKNQLFQNLQAANYAPKAAGLS